MELLIVPIILGGVTLFVLLYTPKSSCYSKKGRDSLIYRSSLRDNSVTEEEVFKVLEEAKIEPLFLNRNKIITAKNNIFEEEKSNRKYYTETGIEEIENYLVNRQKNVPAKTRKRKK